MGSVGSGGRVMILYRQSGKISVREGHWNKALERDERKPCRHMEKEISGMATERAKAWEWDRILGLFQDQQGRQSGCCQVTIFYLSGQK